MFSLLGLWIIVVQTRHREWRQSAVHRRRAYGVALHFSLPGLMSLLSLVDPASTTLWRVSFAVVAAGGVMALVLVRAPAPTGLGAAAYGAAVVLYLLIARYSDDITAGFSSLPVSWPAVPPASNWVCYIQWSTPQ
jgi:hypothetical protein